MTEVLKPEGLGEKILLLRVKEVKDVWCKDKCNIQQEMWIAPMKTRKRYARRLQKGIAKDSGFGKINGNSITNSDDGRVGS